MAIINKHGEVVPAVVAEGRLPLSVSPTDDDAAPISLPFFSAELSPPVGVPSVKTDRSHDVLLILRLTKRVKIDSK